MKFLQTMSPQRLQELVDTFPRLRLAVIGDFFLDKYFDIEPNLGEPSVETGKIAHQVMAIRHSPGWRAPWWGIWRPSAPANCTPSD